MPAKRLFALTLLLLLPGAMRAAEPDKKGPPTELGDKELEVIWKDLAEGDDAGTRNAFKGIHAMILSPKTAVPFLKGKLKPAPQADSAAIAKCIADMDSTDFKVRNGASARLQKFGMPSLPLLEKKLKEKVSLEIRRRLEGIVNKLNDTANNLSADDLRAIRAVEVLEGIGNKEAQEVLQGLAKGGEGARITVDAQEALGRLSKQQ